MRGFTAVSVELFLIMALFFDLPAINGVFESGIAVGVDPTLSDAYKLPILAGQNLGRAAGYAGAWAHATFSQTGDRLRQIYTSAAEACILAGLCVKIGDQIDGDWREILSTDPTIVESAPAICHSDANLRDAITLIMATKANWYSLNHHTGQGSLQGYIRKVVSVKFPDLRENDSNVVTCLHTIGHWASTIKLMNLAGLPNIRSEGIRTYDPSIIVALSPDAKLRFSGMPAGTHRLAVGYEGAKRLIKSTFASLCPDVEDLAYLPALKRSVMEDRAAHHFGASYLTGRPRASYEDSINEEILGRVGIYIRTMMPMSTLAQSPHLDERKVQSYPDYSNEFATALIQYKATAITHVNKALQDLMNRGNTLSDDRLKSLRQGFQ